MKFILNWFSIKKKLKPIYIFCHGSQIVKKNEGCSDRGHFLYSSTVSWSILWDITRKVINICHFSSTFALFVSLRQIDIRSNFFYTVFIFLRRNALYKNIAKYPNLQDKINWFLSLLDDNKKLNKQYHKKLR